MSIDTNSLRYILLRSKQQLLHAVSGECICPSVTLSESRYVQNEATSSFAARRSSGKLS